MISEGFFRNDFTAMSGWDYSSRRLSVHFQASENRKLDGPDCKRKIDSPVFFSFDFIASFYHSVRDELYVTLPNSCIHPALHATSFRQVIHCHAPTPTPNPSLPATLHQPPLPATPSNPPLPALPFQIHPPLSPNHSTSHSLKSIHYQPLTRQNHYQPLLKSIHCSPPTQIHPLPAHSSNPSTATTPTQIHPTSHSLKSIHQPSPIPYTSFLHHPLHSVRDELYFTPLASYAGHSPGIPCLHSGRSFLPLHSTQMHPLPATFLSLAHHFPHSSSGASTPLRSVRRDKT
ncbi:hypothetical protein AVEN_55051-1, partial [Araneus ventricosus]